MGGRCFVFGSNLAGRHGKGAALIARRDYGAQYGVGEGRTGNAYAIPTKDAQLRPRPLPEIERSVDTFLLYAARSPDTIFLVTRIGCGLAGYTDAEIAPLFADAPPNCTLPEGWRSPMNASDLRAQRQVLELCPYKECAGAGSCQKLGSYGAERFCRLRPPLDEIAKGKQCDPI